MSVGARIKKFQLLRPALTPLQIFADYHSQALVGANVHYGPYYSYYAAWSNPTGPVAFTYVPSLKTGHEHYPNVYWSYEGWYIGRCFVYFDTSVIPNKPNVVFDVAELHLYGSRADNSGRDWDLVIQNGQPTYPHHPPESEDWYTGNYSGVGGYVNKSLVDGYFSIPLNATGKSWINKGGETKLALRVSREINADPPPLIDAVTTVYEEVTVVSSWFPADWTKRPWLFLKYHM